MVTDDYWDWFFDQIDDLSPYMTNGEWYEKVYTQVCREPGCGNRIEGVDDNDSYCELFCCKHRPI